MTPVLNAALLAVAILASAAVYSAGEAIEKRWDIVIEGLRR